MINSFKHKSIDFEGSLIFVRNLHLLQSISKTLNTNTNWSVSEVRVLSFNDWVIVIVNDLVEVLGNSARDFMKLVVVAFTFVVNESGQSNRSQVADCDFIRTSVFDNLSAQVRTLNGS